jgi:hypothetical protein
MRIAGQAEISQTKRSTRAIPLVVRTMSPAIDPAEPLTLRFVDDGVIPKLVNGFR